MNEFNKMFEDLNKMIFGGDVSKPFPIDIVEIENGYVVYAELPGVKKEDVNVNFEDGYLTIEASRKKIEDVKYLLNERVITKYKRTISFNGIEEDTISAKLDGGILVVTIMVKVPEEKVKKNIIIE